MKFTFFKLPISGFGLVGRKLTGLLLCLFFAQMVSAQTYVNNQNVFYAVPGPPQVPQINATAFDNESIFSVSYQAIINNQVFYCQPWWGTLFYTNNGQLLINSPVEFLLNNDLTAFGFKFDLQQTNSSATNQMADTFYNPGIIHCNSILDGNFAPGACIIQATNVIIPGTIAIGSAGSFAVNGQNVDLSRSVISMEPATFGEVNGFFETLPPAPFTGTGDSGVNTNAWDPSTELGFVNPITGLIGADSPPFRIPPFILDLNNCMPYDQQTGENLNRSAFVENDSPTNVTYNVYFAATTVNNVFIGSGDVTVEWEGTYLNYATGQTITNHLYLNDDYVAGAVTNVPIGPGGYPDNFVLTQSATELVTSQPSLPQFPVFDPGIVTNNPYVFADFLGNGVGATNVSVINPSGSITNLPGSVRIFASHTLNLSAAQITDPGYMSLNATNEFDNSGADMDPLYSDINLAKTNGSITISNLVESQIPDWNGTIQAWSTRWFDTVSNIVITISNNVPVTNIVVMTNEWRTVLVDSDLNPQTSPQIRNLTLNATNSLVISDVLNVFGSMFANANYLTLTTNVIGAGASSPDGELNLQNIEPTNWKWPNTFPNLLWITNNGAIRLPNFALMIGNSATNQIITNTSATFATATLSSGKGTNVLKNNAVTIGGGITYIFTNSITSKSPPYAVLIGRNFKTTMTNLIAAINRSAGGNKVYSTNKTYANGFVTAGPLTTNIAVGVSTNFSFTVTARVAGPYGNIIPVGTTATNLTWSPTTLLAGGSNAVAAVTNAIAFQVPYGSIINNGLLADQGSQIWVTNFQSGGVISNGVGSFNLNAVTATLTNGQLVAGGDIILAGSELETTNLALQSGRSLVFEETNLLTDMNASNANVWTVGSANGGSANGLVMPVKPASGDLLATTIGMTAPAPNKIISSTWAGADFGVSTNGYYNNAAIGQLSLNAVGQNSSFYFTGVGMPGVTNAIYVDRLILLNYASYANGEGNKNIPTLLFNTNLVIYYADAVASASVSGGPLQEVSFQLNGSNTNRLRWVPEYVGIFSSTNFAMGGVSYRVNTGLLQSPLDSSGYGVNGFPVPNAGSPYPFFVANEVNLTPSPFKPGQKTIQLTWNSIPSSTNTIYYSTNMTSWTAVTTFISPTNVPPVGGWPITNVVNEPIDSSAHGYYRVSVSPNSADVYGQ
ncbi:MAG TPA: hypothetical protein VMH87_01245 [Pseudomonadales bacterium]|nr:hypothetical protein [Pseudomonadales bacterium]